MGRYLDIARKFDTTRQDAAPFDSRLRYQQEAAMIADDCSEINPHWLIERDPELWEQIKRLDEELTRMEEQRDSESVYSAKLIELVTCVHEARARHEHAPPLPQ
jgi:hypothetical protein